MVTQRECVTVEVAGRSLSFDFDDPWYAAALAHVLRDHATAAPIPVADATIQVRTDAQRHVKSGATMVARVGHTWTFICAPRLPHWTPEHAYYWLLFPLLTHVLGSYGLLRLHGAMVWDEPADRAFVAVGPRGAGKSTLAATWLADGGHVLTDDTVFVDCTTRDAVWYGLRRDLHVDPELASHLAGLPGLEEAREYLPGQQRVAYDWVRWFPERVVRHTRADVHIILSHVAEGVRTRSTRGTLTDVLPHVGAASTSRQTQARAEFAARFAGSSVWLVAWGSDVWQRPERHRGYVRALAGAWRTSESVSSG